MEGLITPQHIEAIKQWLEEGDFEKELLCPFTALSDPPNCALCEALFPLIVKEDGKRFCPCHLYPFSHVMETAKKIVKGKEVRQNE